MKKKLKLKVTKSNRKPISKETKKVKKEPILKNTKKIKPVVPDIVEPTVAVVVAEKTGPNVYFTRETEQGIIEYNLATDAPEKNKIYNEKIQYAFEKIAENVYNTFKFSYSDVSPLEVQKQAISHMVANIDKFEAGKGKAFSYFSIVAKNWFILDNNNNYRRFKKHIEICEHPSDSGEFVIEPEHQKRDTEVKEFIGLMVDFWDNNVNKYFTKDRDLEIANAVIEIFRNSGRIDVFNKKALYLYIRDIAGCQTQHITKVINRMKDAQKEIADQYFSKGTINSSLS
jgi:hypothetical protein